MKISEQAIDQPRVVLVCTILVIACATIAAVTIPVQRTPAITKAVILVAVPHPGAQPTEVEEQITREIEKALRGLKNVDFISSTSMRGSSVTQVIFLDGVDPDIARGEVQDLVEQIKRELPSAREIQPVVREIDFENTPLMLVNMSAPDGFDERTLKEIAEEVQDELELISGVANTQLFGGREREIHVDVNLDLAAQFDLTHQDFRRVLSDFHAEIPGGQTDTGNYNRNVRNETKFRSVHDIENAILRRDENRVIRVGDVAEVTDTHRRLINIALLDGDKCATIIVNKEADINTLQAAQDIKAKVADLQKQYPHIKFSTTRDTSEEISIMFRVLGSSFVFGAMLVLIILGWAMGLRISLLVLLAIPLSSAVGLSFLYLFDIPLSNMVIFSFILVLGMVVDGAIIVAENIYRHVERGEDPVMAAKIGIREVGMPVIVADLTTVAAYLPMLLVPGMMGDFMSVMPKVVSVSLLGSVLVDHFLIPVLAARWFSRKQDHKEHVAGVESAEGPPAPVPTHTVVHTHGHAPRPPKRLGLIARSYAQVLRWALGNRWAIIACTVLALFWAGNMMGHIGFDFFPASDRGQFEIKYELPLGYSIEQTLAAGEVFTEPLRELQEEGLLVHFVSAIGSSEGLASRLENDPAVGPEFGTIMVQLLSPLDRTRPQSDILKELRRKFEERVKDFPGLTYQIKEVEEGPPGGADVAVRLTGDDLDLLGRIGKRIANRLATVRGTVDATTDYRDENPEIVNRPIPAVLAFYDITPTQLSAAVQMAVHGDTSIELTLGDEDVPLRLQAAPEYRQSLESIKRMLITGSSGRKAPVSELSRLRRTSGLYAINRYKFSRAVVAKCDVIEPTSSDDVFKVLREDVLVNLGFEPVAARSDDPLADFRQRLGLEPRLPKKAVAFIGKPGTEVEGVKATFTGENEERDKNFRYLLISMIVAVVLIFALLVWQFNSFRQTVIVLLAVPLSFVGVVAGMWLCDFPFSLASFIGLVSLTGVVVNDSIVIVDFINQARARGMPVREAILDAGVNRLRPVILTTVTTIGGLLPLFLNWSGGAEFWQPLTAAVIFGLAFATVLTLLVIPVGYSLVYFRTIWREDREGSPA